MIEPKRFSFAARCKSFTFALKGLRYLVCHEHNFSVHIAIAIGVIGFCAGFQITKTEWLWLIIAIGSVMSAEAMNTAIERVCDAVTPNYDRLIGVAKDVAAGAVLINAGISAIIGMIIFGPYLLV